MYCEEPTTGRVGDLSKAALDKSVRRDFICAVTGTIISVHCVKLAAMVLAGVEAGE